ncbi:PREDICTED: hamartin [Drosophila arizonae]|uniref:Hamartin n=1 Tax=Drosophila arizonae TaxID=7263 RepID=A0ABM1P085_DROAR|nr:PREDICTED: hamartin [Drosophila arizonae]
MLSVVATPHSSVTNMDFDRTISGLESNQTFENEEAKKKLVELFTQTREQWPVRYMLDYYLKTGSMRIMEVLVKAQPPHDSYIFDRLDDWLKQQQYRVQALNVFCFIVRRHPTWLHKIEKHRLIKSVFKLLTHEKDIVPLMSALLCIITLLPIIPNSVPNFLNDLFEVFGHLASWKFQNVNKLPDDKVVHLQLGLQMLFHRLYGMYPCNFLSYLSEFIKKDKGSIFQHTIKPLLDTVRVHPMLLTATTETEVSNMRWKEMEPHDVVMECAHLSLPVLHPDSTHEDISSAYPCSTPSFSRMTSTTSYGEQHNNVSNQLNNQHLTAAPLRRFESSIADNSNTPIWSPHNELAPATASSAMPLTPTPFIVPPSSTAQLLVATGSSPPEAAVEATPETTPLKDLRDFKQHQQQQQVPNSHTVRAIFANSQPSSPMRKDHQSQFHFPDISKMQPTAELPQLTDPLLTGGPHPSTVTLSETKDLTVSVCGECNETDRNLCSDGGLHMPTNRTIQQLAKGVKRRNRMASYCCNESSFTSGWHSSAASKRTTMPNCPADNQIRRTKSCSALPSLQQQQMHDDDDEADCPTLPQNNGNGNGVHNTVQTQKTVLAGTRLQRSGRMLALGTPKNATGTSYKSKEVQTLETVPIHYEEFLFELLRECKDQRNKHERSQFNPQEILDQYIMRSIHAKESFDSSSNLSTQQEQWQLMCLQLLYERYRRSIHAERNRRLMGRSRDKRSLEMERDRLQEQLKNFDVKNQDLAARIDLGIRQSNEQLNSYIQQLADLKSKYQYELDQKKCLRQANDDLQTRLNAEMLQRKEMNYEVELLRGQIFTMTTELQHAQQQADLGQQYKQELARLEAEFIIMGEVQVRCRDRLAEIDNYRSRDEELKLLQESFNAEIKDLKHNLDEKTSLLESTKHKISEQAIQLGINDKVIAEQKRLLRTVKDEYEEMLKSVNKKYEIQKKIIIQMEEKLMMSLQHPQGAVGHATCSPDTDRTDIASSMERNSPLSTSLASSESLSASLRSTELKNLQQLLETPAIAEVSSQRAGGAGPSSGTGVSYEDNASMSTVDLASSAGTASAINIMQTTTTAALSQELNLPTTSNHTHAHPHLHLQQQQEKQQQPQQQ